MRSLIDYIVIFFHRWFWLPKPDLLVVVRHGQSATNELYDQGQSLTEESAMSDVLAVPDHKVHLTQEGKRQANVTGPKIKGLYGIFDAVYHSDYKRAEQTLDEILKAYTEDEIAKMKIRSNAKLGERQRGYLYDLAQSQIDKIYPFYEKYAKKFGYFWTRPPGGESHYDVVQRIYDFLGEMFRHRPKQKVLIVCHGGIVRGIRYNLERWKPDDYENDAKSGSCENASVMVYRRNRKTNQLELESFNQVYY